MCLCHSAIPPRGHNSADVNMMRRAGGPAPRSRQRVRPEGLEPPTTRLRKPVLYPLSYGRKVAGEGFEPPQAMPTALQAALVGHLSNLPGWSMTDSNRRPLWCGHSALPSELTDHGVSSGDRTRGLWSHNPALARLSFTHHEGPQGQLLAVVQGERQRAGCVFAGERGFRGGSGCGGVACDDTVSVSEMGRPSPLPFREVRGGP